MFYNAELKENDLIVFLFNYHGRWDIRIQMHWPFFQAGGGGGVIFRVLFTTFLDDMDGNQRNRWSENLFSE